MGAAETVSRNVQRLRRARGWTQEEAGQRFGAIYGETWSPAVWSAAERADGKRQRAWTADEVASLAALFEVKVADLFEPDSAAAPGSGVDGEELRLRQLVKDHRMVLNVLRAGIEEALKWGAES